MYSYKTKPKRVIISFSNVPSVGNWTFINQPEYIWGMDTHKIGSMSKIVKFQINFWQSWIFPREKNLFKVGFQPKNEYFVDFDEYS